MTPTEIISQNIKAIGKNPAPILRQLSQNLKAKKSLLLRHNDSVLVLNQIAPKQAELHLFTVDKPMALIRSIKEFIKKVRASDLDQVYGQADNPQIVKALEAVGVDVQKSDNPKYNWRAKV